MKKRRKRRKKSGCGKILAAAAILAAVLLFLIPGFSPFSIFPQEVYTAEDFGIETVISSNDYNQNGVDDYTDIMLGARADAENMPIYKSAYYEGGYPPDDEGVCTDLVWRAFKNAGYSLKDMVDEDIAENTDLYPRVNGEPDPNIDFRRVPNLKVFFDRYAVSYTIDVNQIDQWQPGDIVIFGDDYSHIGIVSDKRNEDGIPYLIHNSGQPNREEDALSDADDIVAHYRFEEIPEQLLS